MHSERTAEGHSPMTEYIYGTLDNVAPHLTIIESSI